jgi:hypothetical protein
VSFLASHLFRSKKHKKQFTSRNKRIGSYEVVADNPSFLTEFKEIRKEWKARKKEEENQRKAAEERERQAAAQAQAQPEGGPPADPSQGGQPSAYAGGVRQLPPIGYQPAENQVPGQYAAGGAGQMVYPQGNAQIYSNYPHSPYAQNNQVYQRK